MKNETYLKFIKYTIATYNKSTKKALLNLFKDIGIARKKEKQIGLFDESIIEIDEHDIDKTLQECISKRDEARKIFEDFQFKKSYKYAVLFVDENIANSIKRIKEIPCYDQESMFKLSDIIENPLRMELEDKTIVIFNKKYEAIHPQTQDELLLQYPIIIVIHNDSKIVEIRFDSIKRVFTGGERDQTIYIKLVDEVLQYMKVNYGINLTPLELEPLNDYLKTEDIDNIKLVSQYMNFKDGGKAQLTVGDNDQYILPIIGELKNLMNELSEELDNNIKIKDALEQFIYEKEETTDYPWIEVLFLNEEGVKTRNNHVKFTFNYMNKKYCLINYYYNETMIGMERMDYVTRFIDANINTKN